MPHSSTGGRSVVARLAFAFREVNAYRGSLRYPGWFLRPPWGIILFSNRSHFPEQRPLLGLFHRTMVSTSRNSVFTQDSHCLLSGSYE